MRCSEMLRETKKKKKISHQGNAYREKSVGIKGKKAKLQPERVSEQNMLWDLLS